MEAVSARSGPVKACGERNPFAIRSGTGRADRLGSVSGWSASEGLAPRLRALRGHHASCRPSDIRDRPAWLDRSVASPPLRCAHRPVPVLRGGGYRMVILGIDAHKRTHTVVAIDEAGRELGTKTTLATTTEAHLDLVRWADRFGPERRFAVEDCRHLSRRLEADLLAAGEVIVRVPPKLMAHARDSARTYGKSDPIDALAVARAALREPNLPVARLDGPSRELRLLVDHREDLVRDRTAHINPFRSKAAFARHNGTAPLPVWSSNRVRHRLSRTGNRQLNCSIHRIAVTQKRCHEGARTYLERRMANGDTKPEALRALKRKLS